MYAAEDSFEDPENENPPVIFFFNKNKYVSSKIINLIYFLKKIYYPPLLSTIMQFPTLRVHCILFYLFPLYVEIISHYWIRL